MRISATGPVPNGDNAAGKPYMTAGHLRRNYKSDSLSRKEEAVGAVSAARFPLEQKATWTANS